MSKKPFMRFEFNTADLLVKLDTTLPGDAQAIMPIVHKIMSVIKNMGCAAGREFEIEQSLSEALNNAIEHGVRNDPKKKVQCCVACDHERGMIIVVRDPGPGFDPASIPSPVLGSNLYSEGGRGIYLINQLMDEVRFEKGGTEIHMRMNPPDKS